jgi:uncharacterized protein YneF (UPF0154 family)
MSLETLGLCANILGAFFLAKAIIAKNPRIMIREILHLRVDHLKVFRRYLIQKLEAIAGFVFLFLGSGLQIYASGRQEHGAGPGWGVTIVLTMVVMALIALFFHAVCSFFARRIFTELLRDMIIRHRFPLHREEALTKQIGQILRIPEGREETVESYVEKVRQRLDLPPEA